MIVQVDYKNIGNKLEHLTKVEKLMQEIEMHNMRDLQYELKYTLRQENDEIVIRLEGREKALETISRTEKNLEELKGLLQKVGL